MLKSVFAALALLATAICPLASQSPPNTEKSGQVTLIYLGTAGWEISDGTTVILIDPYLSRINGPRPPGAGSAGTPIRGGARPRYGMDDVAGPDVAKGDSDIKRADFVLVT